MDTLKDIQKYLEYQLQSTPKYIKGWGGKDELNLLWSGINNSKTIIDAALSDPEKFHELVKQI
jgi:hypothetical protein